MVEILGKRFRQRCSPPPPGHFESRSTEEELPGKGVIFDPKDQSNGGPPMGIDSKTAFANSTEVLTRPNVVQLPVSAAVA